ncbi:MAG: AAA family ATPase [Asgard group archaeon]|nr:AAA family ATPase [Asgard group archaeon]
MMMRNKMYSGVKVIDTIKENVDQIFKDRELKIWDNRFNFHENQYVVLKDGFQASALAKVKGNKLILLGENISVSGIKPRNKEQQFAFDALLDTNIECVALTGQAGVGKTLLAISSALHLLDKKKYKRIIITKDMTQLGDERELGFLPGDVDQKFTIFNQGTLCNMGLLVSDKNKVEDLIEQYDIEFLPLAVVKGSSWEETIVIADEVQNLSAFKLKSLGSRMCANSKLILLADYDQIDLKMKKKDCGLYKFVNDDRSKNEELIANIHLIKCERGRLSKLFVEILGEKDE